jgi:hypothetical protein
MSLYKYGISDKTIGAMQNSDPEVQQMLENAQQNNQTQPPASNGIMDIIKELFGFGDAQSSDLGEIANLRSISDPKTPKLALEPLYPNFGAPMPMETNNPYNYAPELDVNLDPEVNMGATGTVPTLKQGILSQVDSRFPLYDEFTVAEEGDDLEDNAVTVDELGNLKQPSGFKDFLKTMLGFAIPGAGLFTGDRSALQGIKSLNQRLRNTDFARSSSLADYLDAKSYGGRDERDAASARTMAQARGLQKQIDQRKSAIQTNQDRGRGDRPGGANYSAPSKPSKASSYRSSSSFGKSFHG